MLKDLLAKLKPRRPHLCPYCQQPASGDGGTDPCCRARRDVQHLLNEREEGMAKLAKAVHAVESTSEAIDILEGNLAIARELLQGAWNDVKTKPECECRNCTLCRFLMEGTAGREFLERQRGMEIVLRDMLDTMGRWAQTGMAPAGQLAEQGRAIARALGDLGQHEGRWPS